jgi:multiple antibiotic resistance protein
MGEYAGYFALCSGSLIAILSPFATVPAFLAMTEGNGTIQRVAMARRACLVACCVIVAFSLLGLRILGAFQITVPAFQIAGGIVILRVALEMLKGSGALKVTDEEAAEGTLKDDVAITPLAVPMLAGPGTITTAVLLSSQASSYVHHAVLLANVLGIYALTYVLLRFAAEYSFVLGEITLKVLSRLMGLLLAGIAVQFVLDGVKSWGPL